MVTSATSLIHSLVQSNPDEYQGCVQVAVGRLSRVSPRFLRRVRNSLAIVISSNSSNTSLSICSGVPTHENNGNREGAAKRFFLFASVWNS